MKLTPYAFLIWVLVILWLTVNTYTKTHQNTKIPVQSKSEVQVFWPAEITKMKLIFASNGTNISDIRAQNSDITSVVNGPYFGYDQKGAFVPAGVLVQDGKMIWKINYEDPNLGYFFMISSTGSASITSAHALVQDSLQTAHLGFQAGPLLIQSGSVVVQDGASWHAGSAHERTAIGIDSNQKLSWFTSQKPMTLRDFSNEIHQREPQIQVLLNLDGGPSTAYWSMNGVQFREQVRLPYFFVVQS